MFKEVSRKINKLRLNNNLIDFIDWVSKYTLYSKGNILKMIIPNLKILLKFQAQNKRLKQC